MSASLPDDLSNNTPIEIDTNGQVTAELPLASVTQHNDASSSSPTRYVNRKRSAVLVALLVALVAIIGISVGVSNNNNAARNKGSTVSIQKQDMKQQPPGKPMKGQLKEPKVGIAEAVEAPMAAPVKTAVKQPAPKKVANVVTPFPTEEGTFTVSTEVSAPPTVGNRVTEEDVIESPTWRG